MGCYKGIERDVLNSLMTSEGLKKTYIHSNYYTSTISYTPTLIHSHRQILRGNLQFLEQTPSVLVYKL